MMFNKLIPAALGFAALVNADIRPPITGHDFDFKAVYPSGLELSTKEPPKSILPPDEIAFKAPVLTLIDPDEAAKTSRYIAFAVMLRVPTFDALDDVVYTFPWSKTNLTVLSNGTLAEHPDDSITRLRADEIEGGEVRNATINVWRQTPDLMKFFADEDAKATRMPIWFSLARIWTDNARKVSMDFPKANIDMKMQNATGDYRCDIDNNGTPISGISAGATTCTRSPTAAATKTSLDASATGTGTEPTGTGSSTQSAAPNAAPSGLMYHFGYPAMAFLIVLHGFAASLI